MVADFSKRFWWQVGGNFIYTVEARKIRIFTGIQLTDNFSGKLAPANAMAGIADSIIHIAIIPCDANCRVKI